MWRVTRGQADARGAPGAACADTSLQARLVPVAVEELGQRELTAVGDEREHAVRASLASDLFLAQRPGEVDAGLLLAAIACVRTGSAGAVLAVRLESDGGHGGVDDGATAGLCEDGADRLLGLLSRAAAKRTTSSVSGSRTINLTG